MNPNANQQTEPSPPQASTVTKFPDLPLRSELQKTIAEIGYETPSPIQAQAIPHLLSGRDILGVAQTGTGKTAAFALPILSNMDNKAKGVQVLCLAPTRELAIQVAEAFQSYAKHLPGFKVLPIYGGADYRGQIRQLERGVHVVVGTPGRVMDHMRRKTLVLDNVKTLVLDEADEMLRMGFIDDVEWILEQMPTQRQTALFSATMPTKIKNISKKYLQDPAEVTIKLKTTTAATIHQRYLQLNNNEKLDTLTRILDVEEFDGILIFVRTKNATLEVADRIQARGYATEPLNGDIAQNQREKTVARLKSGKIDILVATDVAARGLDVERISHVINYDVPYDTESYVHRIGRTGRAGRKGDAILFVNGRERRMLQAIERATRQKIEPFKFPSVAALNERKIEQLFARIDTELQKDLAEYRSVVDKYLQRGETDPLLLAAAIASLEGGGKPFYIKETVQKARRERERFESMDRSGFAKRSDRLDRPTRPEKPEKREGGKKFQRDDMGMETYRLEVGEAHGVSKGDIVGAIANEGDIESRYMGKIFIYEEHSLIDLPEGMPKELRKTLKKVWLRGRQLKISLQAGKGGAVSKPPKGDAAGSGAPKKREKVKKPGKKLKTTQIKTHKS